MKRACTAAFILSALYAPFVNAELRRVVEPLPTSVAEATVGSALLTELQVAYAPPTRSTTIDPSAPRTLSAPLSLAIGGGNANVPAGETVTLQVFDGRDGYVAVDRFISANGQASAVVFLDLNSDSAFDEVWVHTNGKRSGSWVSASLSPSIPYTKAQPKVSVDPGFSEETFRRELLYLGFSKGTLKIQYREFDDRVARAAFFQDLTYDIERFPSVITFRTYRIEVIKADNSGIRYRILDGS